MTTSVIAKRGAAFLLAAVLALTMLPTTALAATSSKKPTIKVAAKSYTLAVGTTVDLKAKVYKGKKATKTKVTYKSSNKKVATVSKTGKVTAKKAGKATITLSAKKAKKVKVTIKVTALPASAKNLAAQAYTTTAPGSSYKTNYLVITQPKGNSKLSYTLDGAKATPTPVLSDNKLVKIALAAGKKSTTLQIKSGKALVYNKIIKAASAAQKAPATIYGTVPMAFSEFFYDITANKALPTATSFAANGTVDAPVKFINPGTRTGALGTQTYEAAKSKPAVDSVSSASYGDAVHFVPNGNLAVVGDRNVSTEANAAITGILAADVSVSYDLYANASILQQANKATAQSAAVLAKVDPNKFKLANIVVDDKTILDGTGKTVTADQVGVYKVKPLLTNGNWGARVLVNAKQVNALPGKGNAGTAEAVAYGATWGDRTTGFSFGSAAELGVDFAGANYWDNFANNIYGGVITDSTGHSEPLVFLQNLFTHRMHEDFDVDLSNSKFPRFDNLKSPDTYKVTVFVKGFEDVTFEFSAKNLVNRTATITPTSTEVANTTKPVEIELSYVDSTVAADYAANAKLTKGGATVPANQYSLTNKGNGNVTLTLNTNLLAGSYQGSYALNYENTGAASKTFSFTLVNPADIKLSKNSNGSSPEANGYLETTPLTLANSGSLYFDNADFAKSIVASGRGGFATLQDITDPASLGTAATFGTALTRVGASDPYHIDLGDSKFQSGHTYKLVVPASGFKTQNYWITIS